MASGEREYGGGGRGERESARARERERERERGGAVVGGTHLAIIGELPSGTQWQQVGLG